MLPPFAVAEQRSWAGRLWVGRAHASAARLPWSPAPTSKTGLGLAAPPAQSRYVELEPRSSRATSLGLYPRQPQTSSSLKAIMETAWKTAAVDPVMVVMRSGQEPSEMVIRALLCGYRTSDGQRGTPRLSHRQHVCLPHPQAPAKGGGNHHPRGALAGTPRRWGSRRRWVRDRPSPPHSPPSPAPGSALQSPLSAGDKTEKGS